MILEARIQINYVQLIREVFFFPNLANNNNI